MKNVREILNKGYGISKTLVEMDSLFSGLLRIYYDTNGIKEPLRTDYTLENNLRKAYNDGIWACIARCQ